MNGIQRPGGHGFRSICPDRVAKRRGGIRALRAPIYHQYHVSIALVKRRLDGRQKPGTKILIGLSACLCTVDQQIQILRIVSVHLHYILDPEDFLRIQVKEAAVAFFLEGEHQFHLVRPVFPADVGEDIDRMGGAVEDGPEDVLDGIGLHFQPADRGIGTADAGEEQPQEIVYFRRGGDGGAGIADIDLLLDGDGGRDALDHLHVGLGHPAEELPGIGGKALREAALAFREQRVERQGRLSAAGNARDYHEPVTRDLYRYVLQVVDLRSPYDDIPFCWHVRSDKSTNLQIFYVILRVD